MITRLILAAILLLAIIVVFRHVRQSLKGPACGCGDGQCPHEPVARPGEEQACASCPMKWKNKDHDAH